MDRTNRALQPEQRETPGLGGLDSDAFGELVREDMQGPGRGVCTLPRRPGVPKPGQSSACLLRFYKIQSTGHFSVSPDSGWTWEIWIRKNLLSDLRMRAIGSEGPVNGFKHVGNVMRFKEAVGNGESGRKKRQRGTSFSIKSLGVDGGWLGAARGGPGVTPGVSWAMSGRWEDG